MTTVLHRKDGLEFCFSPAFEGRFLLPVLDNIRDKILHGAWDDYNEAYHCSRLIHEFSRTPGLTLDFHTLRREEEILGIAVLTHGAIDPLIYAESGISISDPVDQVVLFNYFHISPAGRGNGSFWLRDLILPFYADQGYTALYLKSSHPRAFPFYDRLGTAIGRYATPSDNGEYRRDGRIYRIRMQEKPFPRS